MWWLLLIILVLLLLVFFHKNSDKYETTENKKELSKIIWIPEDSTRESWELHNPDWRIEIVPSDHTNLSVLATHGGIWVDKDIQCTRPLDDWLYDLLQPCGFWMYRDGQHICFIASMQQSTLLQKWSKESSTSFDKLCKTDHEFINEWEKVPHKDKPYFKEVSERIPVEPAISRDFGDNVMVASDCNDRESLIVLDNLCTTHNIQLLVYDKCNFCKHVPSHIYSRPLQNKGREGGTFMYFIVKYYDMLPSKIIFTAGRMNVRNRPNILTKMITDENYICETHPLDSDAGFQLDAYGDGPLTPSEVRPFKYWYKHNIGEWDGTKNGACMGGLIKTTREKILKNPKHVYVNLLNQLNRAESTEVAHYMERSLHALLNS
jgi:hypothetical protein